MANLVHHLNRDKALLQAIAGVDNPMGSAISIHEDYLVNERMNNRRESGFEVPEDYQPTQRCEFETRMFRNHKQMEGLEQDRTARLMEWELCQPDLEDYISPPPRLKMIVV